MKTVTLYRINNIADDTRNRGRRIIKTNTLSLKFSLTLILLITCFYLKAQVTEFWLIDLQTASRISVKDSTAAVQYLDSLTQNSYYFTDVKKVTKQGNSTQIYFDKGKNYNEAYVRLSTEIADLFNSKPNIFTKNIDSLKNKINAQYIEQGFTFSRVKSNFKGLREGIPEIEISAVTNRKRVVDKIVFKGYEKLPSRFIHNIEKQYLLKTYNDKLVNNINSSLQNHTFLFLEKPPQTLFTKDSTSVYLFAHKRKSNSFDGIIGFGNDKSEKFTFNGSLNVNFRNIFNGFESVNIFWQRNPDKGQTFDLQTDIPYLFKSNIGGSFKINIFRQDSTYANVKVMPSFYFHLKQKQKIGLRGMFENSTVLDSLYVQGRDHTKKGIGVWYNYIQRSEIPLFVNKTRISAEADFVGTHYSDHDITTNQTNFFLAAERNLHIKGNNYLNLRAESALLNAKNNLAQNELLRFGGWRSLRGFNENSLFADFYYYGTAEYRYLVGDQAFFDVFAQYAELRNKTLELKPKLYSFGLGFNFVLPIGLMSFQISNGNQIENTVKFGDTKIHWGVVSKF